VLWREVEEVDVDIALDCDGCAWVFCEDFADRCLEVLRKLWVVVWSSVDVDDGVGGVCFVFGLVNLEDESCCLGDGDVSRKLMWRDSLG